MLFSQMARVVTRIILSGVLIYFFRYPKSLWSNTSKLIKFPTVFLLAVVDNTSHLGTEPSKSF